MCRLEYQPVRAPQTYGEISSSVCMELVAIARRVLHVGERRRTQERRQAAPEDLPVVGPPVPLALPVVRASLLQSPTGPRDLDDRPP